MGGGVGGPAYDLEGSGGAAVFHPPARRTEIEQAVCKQACLSCKEVDSVGQPLFRKTPEGWHVCGVFEVGCGRGLGHPDGPGCILDFAWMLKHRLCCRGRWPG